MDYFVDREDLILLPGEYYVTPLDPHELDAPGKVAADSHIDAAVGRQRWYDELGGEPIQDSAEWDVLDARGESVTVVVVCEGAYRGWLKSEGEHV